MLRQLPIVTLKQIEDHFARGEESLTLSKFEWTQILALTDPAMATGAQLSEAMREIERIRKVAAPTWKACERVSRLMSKCGCDAPPEKVREWKFYLDQARVVYWQDLPQRLRHKWKDYTGLKRY